jgi:hypothetical protein
MGRLLRQIGIATLMTAVVVVPLVVFSPQTTARPEPDFIAPQLPNAFVPPTFTTAPKGALGQAQ